MQNINIYFNKSERYLVLNRFTLSSSE